MGAEGGENRLNTNINYLLEQYNMSLSNDGVVRNTFYKYFHPKEVMVQNGILSQEFKRVALNQPKEQNH